MIGRCDNHYTLAPIGLQSFEASELVVKWYVLGVSIIATLNAIKKVGLSRSEVLIFASLELRD